MISFTVKGPPVGTNHGYAMIRTRAGQPRMKLTDEAQWFKHLLVKHARAAHRAAGAPEPLEADAVLGIRFVFPTQGSDLDGPVKFVQDAIANGSRMHPGAGLVVNDTRIRKLIVLKADCDGRPRTEVTLARADEACCPHCGCNCRSLLP